MSQARIVRRASQSKVGDAEPLDAVFQQDVRRLDVAMHQPLSMCRREASGDLHSDSQDLGKGERAALVAPLLQRLTADVRHDEIRHPIRFGDTVNGDDVVMHDRRRRFRLASKPPPRRTARRQMRSQHFDRHEPIQRRTKPLEHHAHPTATDHTGDFIRPQPPELMRIIRRREELLSKVVDEVS